MMADEWQVYLASSSPDRTPQSFRCPSQVPSIRKRSQAEKAQQEKPPSSPSPSWNTVIGRNLRRAGHVTGRTWNVLQPSGPSVPAVDQVPVQTAPVHGAVLRVQPAPQAGGEVGGRLAPLRGLGAAVGGEQGEGGAGGDGVGAAGVLLPQVLGDDAVQGGRGRQVALHRLPHGGRLRTDGCQHSEAGGF